MKNTATWVLMAGIMLIAGAVSAANVSFPTYISGLSAVTTANSSDLVTIMQGGTLKTITVGNFGPVNSTSNQTIGGIKTFSSTIVGSVTGNSATVGGFTPSTTPAVNTVPVTPASSRRLATGFLSYSASSTGGANTIALRDSSGNLIANSAPGDLLNIQYLTSGTTYTPTAGTSKIVIEMVGGGGGGGGVTASGSNSAAGAGGAAGTYARKLFTGISGTYSYAIGSAGSAGSSGGGNGGNGGNTTFTGPGAVTVTAPGGAGGTGMAFGTSVLAVTGGYASVASNADVYQPGIAGNLGLRLSGTYAFSGQGGNSPFGGGSYGFGTTISQAGIVANGYGGGGGGAASSTGSAYAGGAGTAGLIIVWEYR